MLGYPSARSRPHGDQHALAERQRPVGTGIMQSVRRASWMAGSAEAVEPGLTGGDEAHRFALVGPDEAGGIHTWSARSAGASRRSVRIRPIGTHNIGAVDEHLGIGPMRGSASATHSMAASLSLPPLRAPPRRRHRAAGPPRPACRWQQAGGLHEKRDPGAGIAAHGGGRFAAEDLSRAGPAAYGRL